MQKTSIKTRQTKSAKTAKRITKKKSQLEPLAHSMEDSAILLGISLRKVWGLVASKHLKSFRAGRRNMIAREELLRFIDAGGSRV
jgi:hypothetical protein